MISPGANQVEFRNASGHRLAAKLEWPPGDRESPTAIAIVAHCFTCTKDFPATARIARTLAKKGFAVLRFDFTGLGGSDGNFADTNFSSNVGDLIAAAEFLRGKIGPPDVLIGHSLGGAAALVAAPMIPEVKGVVTIAAPADTEHIQHLLRDHLDSIHLDGEAEIEVAGRTFTIRKQFLEDIRGQKVLDHLGTFSGSLLVMHSPEDDVVEIAHAARIFASARHPKSFISLGGADHRLSRPSDAAFAAEMIAAWSGHLCLD